MNRCFLNSFGLRVQHSVFVCKLGKVELLELCEKVDGFYFKACSAKLHLGGKRINLVVVPLCKICETGVRLKGCEFDDDNFVVA